MTLKLKGAIPVISKFATGQLVLQLLNVINGFCLLRWLSIEQQALFSLAFGIQTLLIGISDLGFSSSIVALTGNKYDNAEVIDKYVQVAKKLKNILFAFGIIVSLILAPIFFSKQAVSGSAYFCLLPIIAAAYWQIDCGIFSAPLIIRKETGKYYLPQIVTSAFRLGLNYVLFLTGIVSAFYILAVNAIMALCNGFSFKKSYLRIFHKTKVDHQQNELSNGRKEMLRYLMPLFPGLVFNAFYGQLQLFIISFFGKTQNIAEIAALGRLSQIFVLFNSLNLLVIGPYIAKSSPNDLTKKYLFFCLLTVSAGALLSLASLAAPEIFLLILGPSYAHLVSELPFMIISASIGAISGLLWSMNSARKWIFWWGSWTYIGGVIVCQILGVVYLDLSSTIGVIYLGLITSVFVLLLHILTALVGFNHGKPLRLTKFT